MCVSSFSQQVTLVPGGTFALCFSPLLQLCSVTRLPSPPTLQFYSFVTLLSPQPPPSPPSKQAAL